MDYKKCIIVIMYLIMYKINSIINVFNYKKVSELKKLI
jgi:hypothetical protein